MIGDFQNGETSRLSPVSSFPRRTPGNVRCLDHVVPRVRFGRNSYRNLVSCCIECNTRKGDRPAPDFLRTLYRQGRLTPAELDARLRALKALAPQASSALRCSGGSLDPCFSLLAFFLGGSALLVPV
jgi:hypothetical protein